MYKIVFLHRSTGLAIMRGTMNPYIYKLTHRNEIEPLIRKFNKENKTNYSFTERNFISPVSLKNYPYDYYNIWVKNAGDESYMNTPTLELLARDYNMIIFKHCYSASNILEDTGNPDIESDEKRIENFKLQYNALRAKMHEFPNTKFIVWTPAVHVKNLISETEAIRVNEFYKWVLNDWDESGDNIYIWDFYKYETEGGLYFRDEFAVSSNDSHPSAEFSVRLAPVFAEFLLKVAEGKVN